MLSWVIENPPSATGFGGFGTIDQGVGRVIPRGTIRVTPKATTTYTLTAGAVTKTVTVTIPGTTPVTGTGTSTAHAGPAFRGRPTANRIFRACSAGRICSAEPGRGGVGPAPGPTLKPGAEKYRVNRAANPQDTGATSDCMPLIPPNSFGVPYEFQIIQNKDYLVIFHEYPGSFRIVPLNDEPHQVDPDPAWLGDSVGKWDGDTLVIDTIGYNDKTEINGYHHTEDLHTVERLTARGRRRRLRADDRGSQRVRRAVEDDPPVPGGRSAAQADLRVRLREQSRLPPAVRRQEVIRRRLAGVHERHSFDPRAWFLKGRSPLCHEHA